MRRRDFLKLTAGAAATLACRTPERSTAIDTATTPDDTATPDSRTMTADTTPTGPLASRPTMAPDVAATPDVAPKPPTCGTPSPPSPDVATALKRLRAALGPDDAALLEPGDAGFEAAIQAFNGRTMQRPRAQLLCMTTRAVTTAVQWARDERVPFAIRGGGHSYEGLSQSTGVVIDLRRMNRIDVDGQVARVGAGATLGAMYAAVAAAGLALPAGSCPPVGVSGHTLGGGFGFLARALGLSCDNVRALELVDANGCLVAASAAENADLFWACRGAGNGSFGVVTRLDFDAHALSHVASFEVRWVAPIAAAVPIVRAWQAWAPDAPSDITTVLTLGATKGGVALLCHGQSAGSESALRAEAARFIATASSSGLAPTNALTTSTATYGAAMRAYGSAVPHAPILMKGKSDYLRAPMSDEGLATLMRGVLDMNGVMRAHLDAYGGAIDRLAPDATAFVHRGGARYSIQYGCTWHDAPRTAANLAGIRKVYAAMRPFVSGECYVNYPDLELADWARAYWSTNLPRLQAIKRARDPTDLFHHAQSVPLG